MKSCLTHANKLGKNSRNDTNVLEENTQTLQDLVKLLTLKISADEIDKKMMRSW